MQIWFGELTNTIKTWIHFKLLAGSFCNWSMFLNIETFDNHSNCIQMLRRKCITRSLYGHLWLPKIFDSIKYEIGKSVSIIRNSKSTTIMYFSFQLWFFTEMFFKIVFKRLKNISQNVPNVLHVCKNYW